MQILFFNVLICVRVFLLSLCLLGINYVDAQVVVDTNTPGTASWVVPSGVVAVKVETWGGGGRGGNRSNNSAGSGGGGGGAYASSTMAVTSGEAFFYRVGSGSTNSNNSGGNSWFSKIDTNNNFPSDPIVLAIGGNSVANNSALGEIGGIDFNCTGQIRISGGTGGAGSTGDDRYSGGGGGGGGNASGNIGGVGSNGGGNGADGLTSGNNDGLVGNTYGGGGSGARRTSGTRQGGAGGNGRVVITVYYESNIYSNSRAVCGRPGNDGVTLNANVSGYVNTYYPGGASVGSGATSLSVGAVPLGYGTSPIVAGDLLLIIQVQRAVINTTDTSSYGLISDSSTTGYYEYIVAQNNVPVAGGILQFRASGTSNGLKYNYITFDGTSATNRGKGRYQIIRVPQYSSITITQTITAPRWNGNVGGIVVMEVSGTLSLNGQTIHADNRGFRGGNTPNASSGSNLTNYRTLDYDNLGAGKGEGIAGTPRFIWDLTAGTGIDNTATYQGGYSNGDFSRGAPANAGGGGNSHNAGGGGGANSGLGGRGGFGYRSGWNSSSHSNPATADDRGVGAYSLFSIGAGFINNTSHRVFMGGGGGRGDSNNNGTSFGGAGGGIVIISAKSISGTGTISANGSNGGFTTSGDGAGGGGAGGTIFLNVANSSTATINLSASGGNGGNVTHTDIHGPGGGGGGGAIFYHSSGVTVNATANGGVSGTHSSWPNNHGASAGVGGSINNFTQIPVDLDRFNARCHMMTNPMIRQRTK